MTKKMFLLLTTIILAVTSVFVACSNSSNGGGGNPAPETVTVKFDLNGGTVDEAGTLADVTIAKNETLGDKLKTPEKTGSRFVGWFDESGNEYTGTTPITKSVTLKAEWAGADSIIIKIEKIGDETGDDVTVSPQFGDVGDQITINYTLASTKINNRLAFSGIAAGIAEVDEPGTATRTYTIAAEDATDGIITIIATFTHSDKTLETIEFEDESNVTKTYGNPDFTRAAATVGAGGTGAITYESSTPAVASVDNTGKVTILKAGTTTITATKAEDANYSGDTASYLLTVEGKQLTISSPTVTAKKYDDTKTANVTAGTLSGVINNDTVNVSAAGTYTSANVGSDISVTVVYSLSGADADNYIKPGDDTATGDITKADGAEVSVPTVSAKTENSITVSSEITGTNYGQTIEYAKNSTNSAPADGWQNDSLILELNPSTTYFIFARSEANDNCNAGTAKSISVTTDAPLSKIKYDYSTDTALPTVVAGLTASETLSPGYLRLTKTTTTYSTLYAKLPFTLPSGETLNNYTKVVIVYKGISGDAQGYGKNFEVVAGPSNTRIELKSSIQLMTTDTTLTFTIPATSFSSLGNSFDIGFTVQNSATFVIDIKSIALEK